MSLRAEFSAVRTSSCMAIATAMLAALTAATPALAQDDQDAPAQADARLEDNAIVVTGFRQSIANSLSNKRESIAVVDSVTAEDVGKLPDISIADAVSRLPGVAVQTQRGRGEVISIRGFSGDFTGALLNGREVATIDDNRRFDYGELPGDLFGRVDVIKTSSADLIGAGLAGTVNLQTLDPLATKHTLSINVQGELDSYKKLNPDQTNKGYKATAIWIDNFADDTIGISAGVSAIRSPVQNKQYQSWGYPMDGNGNLVIGGAKWFADTNVLYRKTGFGHLVYRPSDRIEVSFDALYTHYKYREYQRGVEVPLVWGGAPIVDETAANGFVTSATFAPVYAVQRNNYNTRDANTLALGANLKYALNDKLHFMLDASYSRAHRHDNAYETYTGTGYSKSGTPDTVNIQRLSNGVYSIAPTLDYTDTSLFQLTDPQGWGYYDDGNPATSNSVVQAGYVNEPDYTDKIKSLRASLQGEIDNSFASSWELGVQYSERTKQNSFVGYYLVPPTGKTGVAVPSSAIVGSVNPAYFNGSTLAYSVPDVLDVLTGSFRNVQPSEATKQWYVKEKVITAYGQMNFNGTVGGLETSGNLGFQLVHTNQRSLGNAAASTSLILPTDLGASYTYFLPSANLRLVLSEGLVLRLGASRTLSRARLLDENASFTVSFLNPQQTGQTPLYIDGKRVVLVGTGGNPYLRPYFSNNFDVSIEKYFAHNQGIVALGAFYKDISNFVEPNHTYAADLSGFSDLIQPAQVVGIDYTTQGVVASPANSGRGFVYGVEAQASVPLNVVTNAVDGLGVLGSLSYTDSAIRYSTGSPMSLPGLSNWVANAQIYFEKWGFNARASYQYRNSFLGEYLAFGAQLSLVSTKARQTLDAQIGYDFKSGPLNGLSLYVQGHNLTNAPFVTYYNDDPSQINNYEKYGATFLAGATYKF